MQASIEYVNHAELINFLVITLLKSTYICPGFRCKYISTMCWEHVLSNCKLQQNHVEGTYKTWCYGNGINGMFYSLVLYTHVDCSSSSLVLCRFLQRAIFKDFPHDVKSSTCRCTAITKGKTPVPVCSPKLSPVGRG